MTRAEFKVLAQQAIEQLTSAAELSSGRTLRRKYCFSWLARKDIAAEGDIAEFLTSWGFVDDFRIWPCWDLFLERLLPDGTLLLMGYRAGFAPCAFGEHPDYKSPGHGVGHVGPFKLGCQHLIEQLAHQPCPGGL
ncbi:MAG TPA: hypothetical protein VF624_18365 [Tepidisphaeraceae bacterium]